MDKLSLVKEIENPPALGSDLVLDIFNNPVSQSILLGNNLQSKFSQFFQRKYDIGAVEWRMLVVLAREPDINMSRITEIIGMDKAAVSRAMSKLDEKRLVSSRLKDTNARSKYWSMTPAGVALHDVILKAAMKFILEIIKDIPEESLVTLSKAMAKMKQNAEAIDWDEASKS